MQSGATLAVTILTVSYVHQSAYRLFKAVDVSSLVAINFRWQWSIWRQVTEPRLTSPVEYLFCGHGHHIVLETLF